MESFNLEKNTVLVFLISFIASIVVVKIFQKVYQELHYSLPGPWGFPLLGHLPLLGDNPALTLTRWSKKYGDIFKIRMGSWETIVLSSKESIRTAMIDYPEVFSDRPPFFYGKCLLDMKSLDFGSYTARWRLHRKIANNILKQYGSSRHTKTQYTISHEAENIVNCFLQRKGEMFNPRDDIIFTTGRAIFHICYGALKDHSESSSVMQFINNTLELDKTIGAGNPFDVLPWLQYVIPWKAREIRKMIRSNQTVVEIEVKDHLKSFDNNHHRDITDGLIAAAEKYGNLPDIYCGITKEEILSTLQVFTEAGFMTVSSTMEWLILFLSFHRHFQKRIQDEIDTVIGVRKPSLEDKGWLPFTEATILEVTRIAQVIPTALPHFTTEDVNFMGHKIRKGTVVFCNTYAAAMDRAIWDDPEIFMPERFLNDNNEIISEKADSILLFGAGRRRCPGENLAKSELFLLTVNIFQRCDIKLCTDPDFEAQYALVCRPKPYQIKVSER